LAFAQGADAVEPDVVATKDGVLVVRHENEISQTTDVAQRREFASRWVTKTVDGKKLTGWFTEDFTWEELQTLRCVERLRVLRPKNRSFDGRERILSLTEVLRLVEPATTPAGRPVSVVIELKHAQYFDSIGLPLDDLLL